LFEGHSLTQFVKHCAEHYLSSEYKEIRMEAVRTCARLLSPLLKVGGVVFLHTKLIVQFMQRNQDMG